MYINISHKSLSPFFMKLWWQNSVQDGKALTTPFLLGGLTFGVMPDGPKLSIVVGLRHKGGTPVKLRFDGHTLPHIDLAPPFVGLCVRIRVPIDLFL